MDGKIRAIAQQAIWQKSGFIARLNFYTFNPQKPFFIYSFCILANKKMVLLKFVQN